MVTKSTRSNRFLEQGDIVPKNLEDSFRAVERQLEEISETQDTLVSALGEIEAIPEPQVLTVSSMQAQLDAIRSILKQMRIQIERT